MELAAPPLHASPAATITADLADGASTTVHVTTHPLATTELQVIVLEPRRTLPDHCHAHNIEHALVGGFYTRPDGTPLGELRTHGVVRRSVPFAAPWHRLRSCLHVDGGEPRIAPRADLPATPRGDLLQAGPLLVQDGLPVLAHDPEGFSAGHAQFDSDITQGRHPRAALGLDRDFAYAVAADGRSDDDAGLTLQELAQLMALLGAREAINLDGGGSTSLVAGGALVNRPRDLHGQPPHAGRTISTAIAFIPQM